MSPPDSLRQDRSHEDPRVDLSSRLAVVAVKGTDAGRFLQAQLSCNISATNPAYGCYGAYLSPQGRVLATVFVMPVDEGFYLLLHPSVSEAVVARLAKYVLRDRVTLQAQPQSRVSGSGVPATLAEAPDLSRLPILLEGDDIGLQLPGGRRLWIAAEGGVPGGDQWWRPNFEQGIAAIEQRSADKHIPQSLGLDRIAAISFTKGCYPGQEIVARVHYLGRAKRALYLLGAAVPVGAGDGLLDAEGAPCGEIIGAVGEGSQRLALAVLSGEVAAPQLADRPGKFLPVLRGFAA